MSKYARGKRGPADGPHNSQGFGFDVRYLVSTMKLSAEAGRTWAEIWEMQKFLRAHPNIREQAKRELTFLSPDKRYDYLLKLMKDHQDEHRRRIAALEKRTKKRSTK